MTIYELFDQRSQPKVQFADIWEHMPVLRSYASQCDHITEIGTRTGNSTTAFLAGLADRGKGELHSYDKDAVAYNAPEIPGVRWEFHRVNTHSHEFQPEATDLLFVDGDHTYMGVMLDLRIAAIARRWIILHDTARAWVKDGGWGVFHGLADFLKYRTEWEVAAAFDNCNGLTVLRRRES